MITGHRGGEYVIGATGERFTVSALDFHGLTFAPYPQVAGFQFAQSAPGAATCRLSCVDALSADALQSIAVALAANTNGAVRWAVTQDDPFELTSRGKVKCVVRHAAAPEEEAMT